MNSKYIFKLVIFFYTCTLANVLNFSGGVFPNFTGDGSKSSLN